MTKIIEKLHGSIQPGDYLTSNVSNRIIYEAAARITELEAALLASNGPPTFSARYFKREWESAEAELAALRARIADGELADIAEDGKHNGESALLSAAIRAGYYRGLPVLVLPASVLETLTARDGGK
jgi:hypothetical protein